MPPTQEASPQPKAEANPFFSLVAVELIKKHGPARTYVGFDRFSSYETETGEWLIGYGSKQLFGKNINMFTRGTVLEIEEQLALDLKELAPLVKEYVIMPLNPKKRAAVLSYAHSIGLNSFKNCRLLELINARASKTEIISEWSPYINQKDYYPEKLRNRRRAELNTYVAPDDEVPLLSPHKCPLKHCLLNIGESYTGTPNQIKAIEYFEKKVADWDTTGEVVRRFFRLWNQEQGGLGSTKNFKI
jgi:GH24 family phage-related lysozyme (muramidase)